MLGSQSATSARDNRLHTWREPRDSTMPVAAEAKRHGIQIRACPRRGTTLYLAQALALALGTSRISTTTKTCLAGLVSIPISQAGDRKAGNARILSIQIKTMHTQNQESASAYAVLVLWFCTRVFVLRSLFFRPPRLSLSFSTIILVVIVAILPKQTLSDIRPGIQRSGPSTCLIA